MDIPTNSTSSKPVLGQGYDNEKQRFAGQCVTGEIDYGGAQESFLTFDRSLSSAEVSSSLGFELNTRARYGVVKGSASAKFMQQATDSRYSETTVYQHRIRFKNARLRPDTVKLTPNIGATVRKQDSSFVWEDWETVCGHEFVSQAALGAELYVCMRLEFATAKDSSEFKAEFNVKGPSFAVKGELKKASEKFAGRASIIVSAYQLGGDVSRLSSIFNSPQPDGSKESAPILRCSIENPDACLEVFDRALTYASDTNDPNAFPQQLKSGQLLPSTTGGPAELVYITEPWANLAFLPPPPLISSLVASAREELSRVFEENLSYQIRINSLKDLKVRFSPSQEDRLQLAEAAVTSNMALIDSAATVCYENPETAVQAVRDLKTRITKLDIEALDYKPETFSQWYALLDKPNTLVSTQETVRYIRDQFKSSFNNFNDLDPDQQGLELERLLQDRTTRLSLYCFQWTPDLRVLSSLQNLEWLDIDSSLGILDLAPLEKLSNLKGLRISNSSLENFETLRQLSNLVTLVLQRVGGVVNLRPFSRLRKLSTLSLRGSFVTELDLEPLERLTELSYLDLGNLGLSARRPPANIETTMGSLVKLAYLDLSGTGQYSDLQFLSQLSSLRTLIMNRCSITDLSSLPPLGNLEYLSLAENQIESLGSITSLSGLKRLNIGGNRITDLAPLDAIQQLLEVNAELNPIPVASDSLIYLVTTYDQPLTPPYSIVNLYGVFYDETASASMPVYLAGTNTSLSILPGAVKSVSALQISTREPLPIPFGVNQSVHALRITKLSGNGQINNGDQVFLKTFNGLYLGCDNGLGKLTLRAAGSSDPQTSDELFTVICSTDGGLVWNGSQIQLSSRTGALLTATDIDAGPFNEGLLLAQDPNVPAKSSLFFVNTYYPDRR
jgi:Leucine-rich repeat (LRR) protein